jgi:hypothetical protein
LRLCGRRGRNDGGHAQQDGKIISHVLHSSEVRYYTRQRISSCASIAVSDRAK